MTSFKSKRDAKKKSLSSHDHNWNTLFLGVNAVAEVMAEQYNTTKGSILDDASSRSLAVRMALGETQVVTETRKFLVSEGVKLDVFGQVCFAYNLLSLLHVILKGEFHGSAHDRILTGLCMLSGTGPGFSLFMNQS